MKKYVLKVEFGAEDDQEASDLVDEALEPFYEIHSSQVRDDETGKEI